MSVKQHKHSGKCHFNQIGERERVCTDRSFIIIIIMFNIVHHRNQRLNGKSFVSLNVPLYPLNL